MQFLTNVFRQDTGIVMGLKNLPWVLRMFPEWFTVMITQLDDLIKTNNLVN